MIGQVVKFIRLPLVLLVVFAVARFSLGVAGVPYTPRGNAMFSVVGLTMISCVYFGALSGKVGGFGWGGSVLVGICLGFFAEALIFGATLVSYMAGLNTYFVHWDALNVPEGTVVSLGRAMATRAGGLVAGPILGTVFALLGRVLGALAPAPAK
jgi:hypothetical protein